MNKKNAQQEMVGFALIVVIVMIGLMVFLVISLRDSPTDDESLEVENMLESLTRYTTDCAIKFEPEYDTIKDLLKSCSKNSKCSNLNNKDSCNYLEETLSEVVRELMKSESTISAYEIEFFKRATGGGSEGFFKTVEGNCTSGRISSAQHTLASGSDRLVLRLKLCQESS